MKFRIVIVALGDLASSEPPDIVSKLSIIQNVRVFHPTIPAANLAPSAGYNEFSHGKL